MDSAKEMRFAEENILAGELYPTKPRYHKKTV